MSGLMKKRMVRSLLALLLSYGTVLAAAPWHSSLCLGNGGYWPQRVQVTIVNDATNAVAGEPAEVLLPALAGSRVESLRVCRQDGVELLFDVRDAQGGAKRAGILTSNDRLLFPVECAANNSTTVFVYAGNDQAWAVPDFLAGTQAGGGNAKLRASPGPVEELKLETAPIRQAGRAGQNRADVRVRNFSEQPAASALVRVNLRTALARLPGVPLDAAARVTSAQGGELASYRMGQGADVLFAATLPARAEQWFAVEFVSGAKRAERAALEDYERLLASSANLAPNGSFENGSDAPEAWQKSVASGRRDVKFNFSDDARFGKRALEFTVPENAKTEWLGWNSRPIPVKPGATYLLSGWLKAVGLKSTAIIHAHFHDAQGQLTKSGAMVGTQPNVSGDSEWLNTRGFVQAPPDAATIQIHLTMNTQGTLRHDGLVLCEVVDGFVAQVHAAGEEMGQETLRVWEVNPVVKVFPDSPPRAQARAVAVELARNEYEPFQLALRGSAQLAGPVEISVSPLRNGAGAALPPVKVERVGFVPIDYPSAYYSTDVPAWCRKVPRGSGATDGWAGWWPDPLAPAKDLDVRQTQPVWFTVRTPAQAAPGEYRAEVSMRTNGLNALTLPLTVRVLPFTLPDRTRLRAIFDFRFGPGGVFASGAGTLEERRQWLRFMAEHRLGIDMIRPEPKFTYQNGKVAMDASAFDETARLCFDELGMNVAYTPQFFYLFGWAYPPKKFFGLEPFTPEWTAAFQQAYRLFSEHLRAKGWHDRFVYYISDEPHYQHAFVVEQMKKLCALIHEVDPAIPIYSSTWQHCAAWDESLDIWGVGQYGCFPVADMQRLRQAGKQMWFTCDGQMATDTPWLATERMLPYYCFKYGVGGFEFWGLAWWTYDPWKIGWHQFIRQSDEGKKYYWIRYPNGDGFLAYPGNPAHSGNGRGGPLSTIRLEQVREGLEDYEAMTMLAELAAKAKAAGKSTIAAERALAMARELVSIPNAGGLRSTEILSDPDRIPQIRKAVNAALVEVVE
jgi:hypothetical protein